MMGDRADNLSWVTAKAAVVSDEVVKFEYTAEEEKREEWIEAESDRIADAYTMTKNLRWRIAADIDRHLYPNNASSGAAANV